MVMTNVQPILKLENITTKFGDSVIHEGLNLDVNTGEILGLVGGSGAGKSVLLRTAIGLNQPATGSVHLRAKQIGMLFQHGALFSSMTVAENVALPLFEHTSLSRHEALRLARLKLALVGLDSAAGERYPAELSGGMIKRAALARALIREPDMVFLDEPTAGLDPISAAAFDQLILTLSKALGLTVVLVTHDLDTLYAICDRVAVLAKKHIIAIDSLAKVAEHEDAWIQAYFHGPRGRAIIESHSNQSAITAES
ncbi:phospholipid/cholesterol/gamma-HCH transport system ATP-binding protein [Pseudidiomarina maritima]|jgi:phospholipid/cholesterol/gamma-HCH transport system ATP-binding protein|uniref:Phospholipid/cholesterol/gamma-HCH transport system ATP-binding protein n=1 Tax=Pseudidiomarina maritima TaxID=519453 RepID=A0A1I6G4I1_9GAMM|nr:ATP-binding cassette domain-containing protein [Pseudidiomarina maritima]SFR37108.1 phospholipid/cholesterol/gamma-HCH transport system ATP-binding protein [Pseudidiomarina maritima]